MLQLSAEPDGFGIYYGWAERNGERVRVDVLPPKRLWRGDVELDGQKPDGNAWIVSRSSPAWSGARTCQRCWASRARRCWATIIGL